MTPKTRIAVLVAALFLGSQAGMAALDNNEAAATAEVTETTQEQQAEATAAAAPEAPEATAAATQPEAAPEAPAPIAPRIAERSSVFPRATEDRDPLPALARYLEQRDAILSKLVARGDVFPRATEDREMLPALVAYLDRRDATRVARAPQPESAPAAEVRSTPEPVALGVQQQAASSN